MPYKDIEKAIIWIPTADIEESAIKQIKATAKHPKLFRHVAIMPDTHAGWDCTIGSVVPSLDSIFPSAVGVDIGCGMCAFQTNLKIENIEPEFDKLYNSIKRTIPIGFEHRRKGQIEIADRFLSSDMRNSCETYQDKFPKTPIIPQLGTLGGGNHFIEFQADKRDNVWIMIHSGSRNIGHQIASKHIKLAEKICKDHPEHMAYFQADSKEGIQYLRDMEFALEFAYANRLLMTELIQREIQYRFNEVKFSKIINIHHNYVAQETHFGEQVYVHRKGATRAMPQELGIIPGSMGTSSFIVKGKGNPDSYSSCSHGAGRTMSRTAAKGKWNRKKKEFTTDGVLKMTDFQEQMKNIFTKDVDRDHLDEAPEAYKDIHTVMENQKDLVDIVVELKPILNIKG